MTQIWLLLFIWISVPAIEGERFYGITFTNGKYCPEVKFSSNYSDQALANLRATGANWVAVVVTQFQVNINSTSIFPSNHTATDDELRHVIHTSHKLGLHVMLKPHIDLTDDKEHWRGEIGTYFTADQWQKWFESYMKFIMHYARLAEENRKGGVKMYCLSCELSVASSQEKYWRKIASAVRSVYTGIITDAANWGGEEINKKWWDVVDYIGVDAYYPVEWEVDQPSVAQIISAWQPYYTSLMNLSSQWNKNIIFTEIGYCSPDRPGNWSIFCPPPSSSKGQQRQANFYQAVLQLFIPQTWWRGLFFWNWATDPYQGGPEDYCFTPFNKPAEKIVRKFFGGSSMDIRNITQQRLCPCIY